MTRAGMRAPLGGRSLGRRQACPVPLVPRGQHLLGHLSLGQTWTCHQVPYPELAETAPWRNGQLDAVFIQDVAALSVAGGVRGKTVPHSSPSQCTGGVQGSYLLSSPVGKALA